jgi:hypothetical protein
MNKYEDQIFAQAKEISKNGFTLDDKKYDYFISGEDIQLLNKRNKKFEYISYEEDMINKYFISPDSLIKENCFMSSGEIVNYIYAINRSERMNLYRTGKALNKLGFIKTQRYVNGNRITGWILHKIDVEPEKYPETYKSYYETEKDKKLF